MKKLWFVLSLVLFLSILAGCTGSNNTEDTTFTLAELAEYDGLEGRKAYIAVDGIVYDVTDADNWSNGSHMGTHLAGTDATETILSSPHGKSVLEDLPTVGTLVSD